MYMNREEWKKKSECQVPVRGICRFGDLHFPQFDFLKDRLLKYKSGQMTYLAQVHLRAVYVSEGT